MALTRTETSAADLALFNADVPCILAHHGFRDAASMSIERWDDAPPSGDDETEIGAPTTRAYDGWAHHGLHTYPRRGDSNWSLLLQVGSTDDVFEADTAVLFGSNLGEATGLQVAIWPDGGYASGLPLSSAFPLGDNVRFTMLALTDSGAAGPNIIYGGIYGAELHIDGEDDYRPRVREFWLGKRIQLPFRPNRPYGHMREIGVAVDLPSLGGSRTGIRRPGRRVERSLEFNLSQESHRTTLRRIWDESRGGTTSLLWIETPSSDPTPHLMRVRDPVWDPWLIAGTAPRTLQLDLVEQSPFVGQDAA